MRPVPPMMVQKSSKSVNPSRSFGQKNEISIAPNGEPQVWNGVGPTFNSSTKSNARQIAGLIAISAFIIVGTSCLL